MQRRSERPWLFLVVFGLAMAAIVVPLVQERLRARRMVANEDTAVEMLRRLRSAEIVFHAREGRYGFYADLTRSDLLQGIDLRQEPAPPHVRTPGYRVDVLLPTGVVEGETVAIATRIEGRTPDPVLASEHFSLVARPTEPTTTGWRIYYLDEDDRLFINEGVVDAESAEKNLLPHSQVKTSQPQQSSRACLWQLLEAVEVMNDPSKAKAMKKKKQNR